MTIVDHEPANCGLIKDAKEWMTVPDWMISKNMIISAEIII
jgi:hypothetical protein